MLAFKGFNSDMTCTLGKGTFKYEIGRMYKEKEANCTRNGFHCCENPLDVLQWYDNQDSRFCVVKADGEINQDNVETKISCTELTVVKEVTRLELAALGCEYMRRYPKRVVHNKYLTWDRGECQEKTDLSLCEGKIQRQRL